MEQLPGLLVGQSANGVDGPFPLGDLKQFSICQNRMVDKEVDGRRQVWQKDGELHLHGLLDGLQGPLQQGADKVGPQIAGVEGGEEDRKDGPQEDETFA